MIALALAALLAAGLDDTKTFTVSRAPEIEVSNINGAIRVEAGGDGQVSVRASSAEAGDFTARVVQEDGAIVAEVCCDGRCPSQREQRGGRGWTRERSCETGRIDFTLRVPADARLHARNVSGAIAVAGVRGEQALKSVSGPVTSDGGEGRLEVKSVSGRIRLSPARVVESRVKTVSGEVELALPRSQGALVSLDSLSGELEGAGAAEEGAVTRRGRRHHGTERAVRGGGPLIAVKSVSGSVRVADR